jgi:hypothetical protein
MDIFVSGCTCLFSEVIMVNNILCPSVHMIWPTYIAPSTETMNLLVKCPEKKILLTRCYS